uniref:VWFA domain-containing protein n=1 Tax=Panagrellus redivivus TaxID=6233 RepID=A0A7E4W4R9_PANRE
PIGPDGQPLPTDSLGRYQFPEPSTGAAAKPPTASGQTVEVIGADGQPLPTDSSGNVLHPETGEPIATNPEGLYLDTDGSILPTDATGKFVVTSGTDAPTVPGFSRQCNLNAGKLDVVFIVNADLLKSYGSVIRHVIAEFVDQHLDLSPDVSRVSLLEFGKSVEVPITLGGYNEKQEFAEVLKSVPEYQELGTPDASSGIAAAQQQIKTFHRDGSTPVFIIFSTGDDVTDVGKDSVQDVYTLIIGPNAFDSEIHSVSLNTLFLDEFDHLDAPKLASKLVEDCKQGNLQFASVTDSHETDIVSDDDDVSTPISENCNDELDAAHIILLIETSDNTAADKSTMLNHVSAFIETVGTKSRAKFGVVNYGATAEAAADIGNYDSTAELIDTIKDIHFISGDPRIKEAIRFVQQLFQEHSDGVNRLQALVIVRKSDSSDAVAELQSLKDSGITVINLGTSKWKKLNSDFNHWRKKLCVNVEDAPEAVTLAGSGIDENDKPTTPAAVVYPIVDSSGTAGKPTTATGQTVEIVNADGQPLPTSDSGDVVHPDTGEVIPTNVEGQYVGPDGSPLPTDDEGNAIVVSGTERPPQTLPTDESGKIVYPIIGSDGQLLPTDATGAHVDADGEPIQTDDFGKPLGPDGQPLPTDSLGRYQFPEPSTGAAVKPTTASGQPVEVIGPDGKPLPTDASGNYVDAKTLEPIPTNADGQYVGPDGSPLPTNVDGGAIAYPTDDSGKPIYPIIGSDGQPLPTDASGAYVDASGSPITKDDEGKPIGPDGQPLPTDSLGRYQFPKPSPGAAAKPTTTSGQPVE